jgi:hypothetical protein
MIENEGNDPQTTDTDPDPEQQDPESGAASAQDESEADDLANDPARNPEDPNLENLKGA